jgi:hypothetical protein
MSVIGYENCGLVLRIIDRLEDGGCFSASEYGIDGDIFTSLYGLDDIGLLYTNRFHI